LHLVREENIAAARLPPTETAGRLLKVWPAAPMS
jgi:hypothetical protein